MKAQGKYNFLLLHDDGVTRSFRISRRAITLLLIIAVLLPVVGGGGVWIGWRAWQDRRIWTQEERVLQQEMAALRIQLDRLAHVERLIRLYESGRLPESDAPPAETDQAPAPPAASLPDAPPPVASLPDAPPAATSSPAASPLPALSDTPQGQEDESSDPDKMAVDNGQVRIDAVSARLSKDRRLRVRMDLYNESGRQIAGELSFFLLTVDEARIPLPHNDATFRISRLKKFASTLIIPDAAGDLTNAALMVEVVNSDKVLLLRQMHPLAADAE